ncbi:MAG TPA: endonuclease [Bacteroidetes bacterium]|nr:endonuclease [Bacteroidota bacterium]
MKRGVVIALGLILLVAGCRKADIPPVPDNGIDFSACVGGYGTPGFEILTFNVQTFPRSGYESVQVLASLVQEMDADLIAFQEVASEADFEKLDELLTGYRGIFYPINNSDWNLAYLYKTAEIAVDEEKTAVLFTEDWYAFPRPPFEIHITHLPSDISSVVINNHLKCCGGSENEARRRSASEQLHAYALTNYPDIPVIILGDLNDDITGTTEEDNVFWSFTNDPENFVFTDMDIASGSPARWSYPSWPSHLDHIIVSDEWFPYVDTCLVFKPEACYSLYPDIISDHRPVFLRLIQQNGPDK